MSDTRPVDAREKEFNDHVWDHANDAFQTEFDTRRPLTQRELKVLRDIGDCMAGGGDDAALAKVVHQAISTYGLTVLEMLLQIVGLTRNKILQDLKGSHASNRDQLRLTSHKTLVGHAPTWAIAGIYLAKRIRQVFQPLMTGPAENNAAFQALNQATWPGYIRQERAKRSGHQAEYQIAVLLRTLTIPFDPAEKADNPLCRDAQIHDVSFDIVVPTAANPRICIKSTVHTANIGQYGESKDHLEIDEARRMIDSNFRNRKPLLIGFIDGVGFESNRAGLRGVLSKSDDFCQFRTIWKLVVIAGSTLNRKYGIYLPKSAIHYHRDFIERYGASRHVYAVEDTKLPAGAIPAGDAKVVFE
jgi:hypothetical protein